jgi:hypothetical protein
MPTHSTANPLWQAHLAQLHRLSGGAPPVPEAPRAPRTAIGALVAQEARRGEWTSAPPDRLGRRLLADVEAYLEFFAIARS